MPLESLAHRALAADIGAVRHKLVPQLWELLFQYHASVYWAACRHAEVDSPALAAVCVRLKAPSFGTWCELLTTARKLVRPLRSADFAALAQLEVGWSTPVADVEEIVRLASSLESVDGVAKVGKRLSSLPSVLSCYRNRIEGHPETIDAAHYERYAMPLWKAFVAFCELCPPGGDFRFVFASETSGGALRLYELHGVLGAPVPVPPGLAQRDVRPNGPYLLSPGSVTLIPLWPIMAVDVASADGTRHLAPMSRGRAPQVRYSARERGGFERSLTADEWSRLVGTADQHEEVGESTSDLEPYLGLHSFTESHSALFFGRQPEVDDVAERLARVGVAFVIGPSGMGKSSLVRGGVIPRLRTELGEYSTALAPVMFRPGREPENAFRDALIEAGCVGDPVDDLRWRTAASEAWSTRGLAATDHILEALRGRGLRPIVVVDGVQRPELSPSRRFVANSHPSRVRITDLETEQLVLDAPGLNRVPIFSRDENVAVVWGWNDWAWVYPISREAWIQLGCAWLQRHGETLEVCAL